MSYSSDNEADDEREDDVLSNANTISTNTTVNRLMDSLSILSLESGEVDVVDGPAKNEGRTGTPLAAMRALKNNIVNTIKYVAAFMSTIVDPTLLPIRPTTASFVGKQNINDESAERDVSSVVQITCSETTNVTDLMGHAAMLMYFTFIPIGEPKKSKKFEAEWVYTYVINRTNLISIKAWTCALAFWLAKLEQNVINEVACSDSKYIYTPISIRTKRKYAHSKYTPISFRSLARVTTRYASLHARA
jgi:hypothetical protein